VRHEVGSGLRSAVGAQLDTQSTRRSPSRQPPQVPFAIVFTKCDSKKKSGPSPTQNVNAFKKGLLEEWESLPTCFTTSAMQGQGKTEVLGYLASLRKLEEEEGG